MIKDGLEVCYGIIDKRFDQSLDKILPFFSMITLVQTYQNLKELNYQCSVLKIEQPKELFTNKEKIVLEILKNFLQNEFKSRKEIELYLSDNSSPVSFSTLTKYLEKFVVFDEIIKKMEKNKWFYKLK